MSLFKRIAHILDVAQVKGEKYNFQTNFSGVDGRHRLTIGEDELKITKFTVYTDRESLEKDLLEVEVYLGIVQEAKSE